MKTALITGGAGFIGSHLADTLVACGWRVLVIDDLSTGCFDNIAHLKHHDRFEYYLESALERHLMTELVDRADAVFHLAAAVGVNLIIDRPVYTTQINIRLTELILELAAKKFTPVLITSTSEVYGKLNKETFSETDDLVLGSTDNSRWCYGASKIIDEFLAKAYYHEKGLPTIIVRLFNTVGPRQTGMYGMVVPRFIAQARAGEPLTVYGDGSQTRSFTWVLDVVEALVSLVERKEAHGETFNLGGTREISIMELAEKVVAMTGSHSDIRTVPYREAYRSGFEDMPRRLPDIAKIRRLIAFEPTMEIDDIIRAIVHWQDGHVP